MENNSKLQSNAKSIDGGDDAQNNVEEIQELEQIVSKTRASIWEHFIRFKQNDEIKAKCKYCDQTLKPDSGKNETSGLKSHNKKYKLCPPNIKLKKQGVLNFQLTSSVNQEGGQDTLKGESVSSFCL